MRYLHTCNIQNITFTKNKISVQFDIYNLKKKQEIFNFQSLLIAF